MGKLYIKWTLGILQDIPMEIDANSIPFIFIIEVRSSKAVEGGICIHCGPVPPLLTETKTDLIKINQCCSAVSLSVLCRVSLNNLVINR